MTVPSTRTAVSDILAPVITVAGVKGIRVSHENKADAPKLGVSGYYINTIVRHTSGGQATLADVEGRQRHTGSGYLMIETYSKLGDGNGGAYDLCDDILKAYIKHKSPNGIWFRNQRVQEIGAHTAMQVNVLVDFTYDFVT